MAKADTGPPTEYIDVDEAMLEAAIDDAWAEYEAAAGAEGEAAGEPTGMRVSAQIEWAGVLDRAHDGHRTTTLDGLDLTQVKGALDQARQASQRAGEARPATSYRAKGWEAQLRALTASKRGSTAADRADLNPTARTLRGWLSGDATPSKANQQKIDQAYGALRNWRVDTANAKATAARHNLAEETSAALRQRYGAEIRLRNITNMELRD